MRELAMVLCGVAALVCVYMLAGCAVMTDVVACTVSVCQ